MSDVRLAQLRNASERHAVAKLDVAIEGGQFLELMEARENLLNIMAANSVMLSRYEKENCGHEWRLLDTNERFVVEAQRLGVRTSVGVPSRFYCVHCRKIEGSRG